MPGNGPLALDEVRSRFDALLAAPVALAVSGGADSMALMHLVAEWLAEPDRAAPRNSPTPVIVLTVDHGLRPEAAGEAAFVAQHAAALGLPHATLVWDDPKPSAGLQSAARAARYRLMSELLEREFRQGRVTSKRAIVTGHHADDQAETFLMRLARGSGLDGLSGMRTMERMSAGFGTFDSGYTILRPLLDMPKARLMAMLAARGLPWREDPSNRSADSERVRMRRVLAHLDTLGIASHRIARSAHRLARARTAVMADVAEVAGRTTRLNGGLFAEIDPLLLAQAPDEIQVRIFAALLQAFGGVAAPARLSQIEALVARLHPPGGVSGVDASGRGAATLGGCRIDCRPDGWVRIWRETGRGGLPELDLQPGEGCLWDARFALAVAGQESGSVRVRALAADGIARLGAEPVVLRTLQDMEVPPGAIGTLPSFWRGGQVVGVPYLDALRGVSTPFSAKFAPETGLWYPG